MEFGILFTSHPHKDREPYPHQAVHARVTDEIIAADRLGFDYAWLAEHHFSTEYGIMPDVWVYAGYLAALTKRIKLGMAVVTLPLANPVRLVENAAFVDILSGGRVAVGLGSGYRKYEFDGFGLDFDARRDMQEEAIPIVLDLFRTGRVNHKGKYLHGRHRRGVRAAAPAASEAASAAVPRRRHRPFHRRCGPARVRAHALDADAIRRVGEAGGALSRQSGGGGQRGARQRRLRADRHRPLGLCCRDRRKGQEGHRGRPAAAPEALLRRSPVRLSGAGVARQGLGGERARL